MKPGYKAMLNVPRELRDKFSLMELHGVATVRTIAYKASPSDHSRGFQKVALNSREKGLKSIDLRGWPGSEPSKRGKGRRTTVIESNSIMYCVKNDQNVIPFIEVRGDVELRPPRPIASGLACVLPNALQIPFFLLGQEPE
jgi:hypothetical protein